MLFSEKIKKRTKQNKTKQDKTNKQTKNYVKFEVTQKWDFFLLNVTFTSNIVCQKIQTNKQNKHLEKL